MSLFLKYFEISFTSFCNFARIGRESEDMKIGLAVSFSLLLTCGLVIWGLNFDLTLFLKVVLLLSTNKLSQWASYIAEINSYIALPILSKFLTLLALLFSIDLPRMYLCILRIPWCFVHLMPGILLIHKETLYGSYCPITLGPKLDYSRSSIVHWTYCIWQAGLGPDPHLGHLVGILH